MFQISRLLQLEKSQMNNFLLCFYIFYISHTIFPLDNLENIYFIKFRSLSATRSIMKIDIKLSVPLLITIQSQIPPHFTAFEKEILIGKL